LEQLQKSFEAWIPAVKAVEGDDGAWYFHGPVASLKKDYDEDILEKASIMPALEMHEKLGGHVDYDHLYSKTHNLDHIIGKRAGVYDDPEMGPCMVTRLFKSKPMAQAAWRHHQEGGVLGYSLVGHATKSPKGPNHKIVTEIQMVTIAPSPKGFDARLQSGYPDSLMGIAKAIASDDGWEAVEIPEEVKPVEKAMTTGSGVVQSGDTGGATLRGQELKGGLSMSQWSIKKKKLRAAKLSKALDEDEDEVPPCGQCGGPKVPLGQLGSLTHYRCRNCGMMYSHKAPREEKAVLGEYGDLSRGCPSAGGVKREGGKFYCSHCGDYGNRAWAAIHFNPPQPHLIVPGSRPPKRYGNTSDDWSKEEKAVTWTPSEQVPAVCKGCKRPTPLIKGGYCADCSSALDRGAGRSPLMVEPKLLAQAGLSKSVAAAVATEIARRRAR